MEGFEACLGDLEGLVRAVEAAGLSEVAFRSPRGSLVLRGAGRGEPGAGAGRGAGDLADGGGPARLVLLRAHCVGRWSRSVEDGAADVMEKDARLGTLSTLLGEEHLRAPGPGRVEKWIIGEGEVAGFGDPLALFREVI